MLNNNQILNPLWRFLLNPTHPQIKFNNFFNNIHNNINKLDMLCYVAFKIHTCTFDVIVKMCTDFYDGDVITVVKDDLMACVTLPEDDKRSGRRRANLKEVHMKDIVSIIL